MAYRPDLADLQFQLFDWLPMDRLLATRRYADWDCETLGMMLAEASRLAREEMAASNEDGDRQGALWNAGSVAVPESFKAVYPKIAEGGWIGSTGDPAHGGGGLPQTLGTAINEVFAGANLSLALVLLLTRGVADLIAHVGEPELQRLYCDKLYSGEWTGTMCLTESQAGSDVGASTTRAVPQEDGSYLISGEKIFITFGEHDLTENIAHAVLARLPGAPEGTRGLSLFLIPKRRVNPDGSLGESNDVYCGGIEHKLGIHGSPTCTLLFGRNGGCRGHLLGAENTGIKLMFRMMNSARVEVGVQAAGVAAAAYQSALDYARERVQSRHFSNLGDPSAPPVPILEHPDVRRMLLTSSAYIQAMRALLLYTSYCEDRAHADEGEEARRYQSYLELLTPVCKAWASDWAFRVTEWCLQVYGGYGYTRDYPAEQYLRDAKITSIYEGTNGIQALDLVGRKIPAHGGKPFRELMAEVQATVGKLQGHDRLGDSARRLGEALGKIGEISTEAGSHSRGPLLTQLNAVPFLDMVGHVLGAHFLLEQAAVAGEKLAGILAQKGVERSDETAYRRLLRESSDAAFYHDKQQAAICFARRALPQVEALGAAIRLGDLSPLEAALPPVS